MIHELKTLPKYFKEVENGNKKFEIRINDRNYQIGDTLILKEYNQLLGYSGREVTVKVLYILDETPYLPSGFVCMSIEPIASAPEDWEEEQHL